MIVCLGTTPALQRTLVFDILRIDAVNRAPGARENASGKSINVARVVQVLGEEALAIGFLGGETGLKIRSDLEKTGIKHEFITTSAPTRVCTTLLDRKSGTATELVEEPVAVEPEAWTALFELLGSRLKRARALVLSGSLPPGGPQDFYADCTRSAVREGIPVILDAAGEPLRRALPCGPGLVKPNRMELQDAVGLEAQTIPQLRNALSRLVTSGARSAVVTLGPEGAIVTDGASFWRITTPPITAVNPIGSGDAVAAGFAVAIARDMPFAEAARLAFACGAANALTDVAGHVHESDIGRISSSVRVEPV